MYAIASPQASITDSKFFLFSIFLSACFLYYYVFKNLPSSTLTYIYFFKAQVVDKSLGPSTIDLKNRKKRKAVEDDTLQLVVKVDDAM